MFRLNIPLLVSRFIMPFSFNDIDHCLSSFSTDLFVLCASPSPPWSTALARITVELQQLWSGWAVLDGGHRDCVNPICKPLIPLARVTGIERPPNPHKLTLITPFYEFSSSLRVFMSLWMWELNTDEIWVFRFSFVSVIYDGRCLCCGLTNMYSLNKRRRWACSTLIQLLVDGMKCVLTRMKSWSNEKKNTFESIITNEKKSWY